MTIKMEFEYANKLKMREWYFTCLDDIISIKIRVDYIYDLERPSLRHKYRIVRKYCRYDNRDNTLPYEEPTEAMKEGVIRKLVANIKFENPN